MGEARDTRRGVDCQRIGNPSRPVRAGRGHHGEREGVEGRGMGGKITKRTQFFRQKANESA